jgi:hypothetical protein
MAGWNFFQKVFSVKAIVHNGKEYGGFDIDMKPYCMSGRGKTQPRL